MHTVFSASENVVCSPEHTVQIPLQLFFAYPFTLLKFYKHDFIINIYIQVIPELADSGPAPVVQPCPRGTDSAQGRAGR